VTNDTNDRIARALKADVVIPRLERKGPLNTGEILASRRWFDDRRRRLSSTGGRPTNPEWTLRRQVPLAPQTWEDLKAIAADLSSDAKIGPGHVAAFLLEDAVAKVRLSVIESDDDEVMFITDDDMDPRFANWQQPSLFAGAA
jgi:hypothetical protein